MFWGGGSGCWHREPSWLSFVRLPLQAPGGEREFGLAYLSLAPDWLSIWRYSTWSTAASWQSYSACRRVSQLVECGPCWHKHEKGLWETLVATAAVSERNSEGLQGQASLWRQGHVGNESRPRPWGWAWHRVTPADCVFPWDPLSSCSSECWSGERADLLCAHCVPGLHSHPWTRSIVSPAKQAPQWVVKSVLR